MQQAGAPLLIIGKGGGERCLQHLREGAEATGGLDFEGLRVQLAELNLVQRAVQILLETGGK